MIPENAEREAKSASQLLWRAAGKPPHKYAEEDAPAGAVCATCAVLISGKSVQTGAINNPTFANHAEFFKFGARVCRACAWLYGDPKRTHRNVLAIGDRLWWPMISLESATEERPSWLTLFEDWPQCDEDLEKPVAGVLTTDPKPRNWPRMRLSTVARPALYIHAPDYDVADWRVLDIETLLHCKEAIRDALLFGFPKVRIYSGLLSDYKRVKKNIEEAMGLESELKELRVLPEFVPALLITGITKEEKDAGRARAISKPVRAGEARGEAGQDHDRLF